MKGKVAIVFLIKMTTGIPISPHDEQFSSAKSFNLEESEICCLVMG